MFGRKSRTLPGDGPRMSADVTQFMAKLGLSEDEIAEMAAPKSPLQRAIDDSEEQLERFVARSNAVWSEQLGTTVNLWPYRMLPARCWSEETLGARHRTTLMEVLGLLPAQPWNIVLLAMDESTASALQLPLHPPMLGDTEAEGTDTAIHFLLQELDQLDRLLMAPTPAGMTAANDALVTARTEAVTRIMAMARPIAGAAVGEHAVLISRQTFFGD